MKFLGLRILALALWAAVTHEPADDWVDPPQVNCHNCDRDLSYSGKSVDPINRHPYCSACLPSHRHHAHTLNDLMRAEQPALDDEDPLTWAHCAECHGDSYEHAKEVGDTDLAALYGTGPNCGHTAGCPNC